MTTTSPLDTAALRAAGREPPMPCRVALADGRMLEALRVLRVLPGKRIVAEARLDGEPVLAKLFVADGAARHLRREREGIEALLAAGLDTPGIIAEVPIAGGGRLLATRWLSDATSLAERWAAAPRPPGDAGAIALLAPALRLLARMHAAGLTQKDLHLGNFLLDGERIRIVDGDAVERHGEPLSPRQATDNLAILLAQLPPAWDAHADALYAIYREAGGRCEDDGLQAAIDAVRHWRLADLLDKSLRDCSLFAVRKRFRRFESVVRQEADTLAPLLADLDGAMAHGSLLKDGRTVTVVKLQWGERTLVIKRYNIKGIGHGLSRLWRPSRAWQSWLAAHRLRFLGIDTPRPLALVEERLGPLRRRAWLVSEWCDGTPLRRMLDADTEPPQPVGAALCAIFDTLVRERIQHGDLKATNLLWEAGRVWLIDLDATTAHDDARAFARGWSRDRARLLRNWPPDSVLARWLDRHLPR